MSEAQEDLRKSMEHVASCSDAINALAASLREYTSAYSGVSQLLEQFQAAEESAAEGLSDTIPQLQAHIGRFRELHSDFTEMLDHTVPVIQKAGELLRATEAELKTTVSALTHHGESLQALSGTLARIDAVLSENSGIAEASQRIQNALGALQDTEGLQTVSRKLDIQIEQIQQEKKEILEPLKNAAAFGAVVRQENEKLESNLTEQLTAFREETNQAMETQFAKVTSDSPDSMNTKLDQLLSAAADIQEKLKEMSESHKGSIFSRRNK